MAFTQSDIDTIDAAIASGAMEVRYSDGRAVRYQSTDALVRAKAVIQAEISGANGGTPIVRQIRPITSTGW